MTTTMGQYRSHRLEVRTSDSHSGNMGSIPIGTAIRFRLRYSEIALASEDVELEKRMSRCNERSE